METVKNILLAPIFFSEADQIWKEDIGLKLLEDSCDRIATLFPEADKLCCTPHTEVGDALTGMGWKILDSLQSKSEFSGCSCLANGTRRSLNALMIDGCNPKTNVVIFNVRNIRSCEKAARKMVKHCRLNSSSVIVTVVRPSDHPCQLKSNYRLRAMKRFSILDNGGNIVAGNYCLSHPFQVDKKDMDALCKNERFQAVSEVGINFEHVDDRWIRYKLSKDFFDQMGSDVYAIEVRTKNGAPGVLRRHNGVIRVEAPPDHPEADYAKLIFMGDEPDSFSQTLCKNVGSGVYEGFMEPMASACIGFIFYLDRAKGETNISEPFYSPLELWRIDPTTGHTFNIDTGKLIHGRQDFPEVLQINHTLLCGSLEQLVKFDEILRSGQVKYFTINSRSSILVKNILDLLHIKALEVDE